MFGRDLEPWFVEAKRDGNPYLTEWFAVACLAEETSGLFLKDRAAWEAALTKSFRDGTHEHAVRRMLVARYAWAVPCRAALDALALRSPVLEIGAGTGYWAWLLRQRGVEVVACDRNPPPDGSNHWHLENPTWTKVERGGPETAARHPGHTLFLCWPPYSDPMASECLSNYAGDCVAYVGEAGGCTADEAFAEALERDWETEEEIDLPQFDGIHDYMRLLRRR